MRKFGGEKAYQNKIIEWNLMDKNPYHQPNKMCLTLGMSSPNTPITMHAFGLKPQHNGKSCN
jgi:hypothetical protein